MQPKLWTKFPSRLSLVLVGRCVLTIGSTSEPDPELDPMSCSALADADADADAEATGV